MRKIGTSFRKPSRQKRVYMPQGGSPQRSKGLKKKGPVLIELVENTLSDGHACQNRPKMGVRTHFFGTRTELFARAHGAWRLAATLRRLRKFHTKCVPSHLILRMNNRPSEESGWAESGVFVTRYGY